VGAHEQVRLLAHLEPADVEQVRALERARAGQPGGEADARRRHLPRVHLRVRGEQLVAHGRAHGHDRVGALRERREVDRVVPETLGRGEVLRALLPRQVVDAYEDWYVEQ